MFDHNPGKTERVEDPLTRLHNRESYFNLLHKRVTESALNRSTIALLVIDITDFHRINHIHGYEIGDKLLYAFASLLEGVRREQDHLARIGDDQFVLLLRGVMNRGHARLAAMKILKLLELPFELGEIRININVAIGIALCPEHASEPVSLMKLAERALLLAKMSGNLLEFAPEYEKDELSDEWDIEIELEDSIEKSQLLPYYQPKVSLKTGKPVGAEALIRWNSPSRGFVRPDLFIPTAEKMGFIKPMTNWLMNAILRQSQEWTEKWGPLSVSINIPPLLLLQPDFTATVRSALNLWPNSNVTLCLEIVERSLVSETEYCFQILSQLRAMGLKVSIDDFGTGYSSLSYFKSIPADELKIDKSFVEDLTTDRDNLNLVKLMIHLAHSFGMYVVAEGVEDLPVLTALKRLNCDQIQGYIFSKPLPHQDFCSWLQSYKGIKGEITPG
ncbi:MAG: bifunctional diguanylate cyclase/phosphodiesterase [Gammaproteobacteria bacterium]|nr:bifunctional diguanylate cyclase/phosphodiesterase [Gammaproteobacteria bacterium]